MTGRSTIAGIAFTLTLANAAMLPATRVAAQATAAFENGPPTDPAWFPIGVWLQSPHHAARYKKVGINLYVGLWDGPTEAQLDALQKVGMRAFCAQNEVGLAHEGDVIVGWMHGDEPDNAQPAAVGYGPPIPPPEIVAGFEAIRTSDPTRPVLLNLGQGAAWDAWHGRGVRTNHPEDYPEYLKGCDIGSFDIYPVTHDHRAVQGRLEFVGHGVRRLRRWSGNSKPIYACIETGHVSNAEVRPTAAQIESEVWIALTCGASGVIYFVHEFAPKFVEAGAFQYPEIERALTRINADVRALAPVLNGETVVDAATVGTTPEGADVAVLGKRAANGDLVLFVASMTGAETRLAVTPTPTRGRRARRVEVLGDDVELPLQAGGFELHLPGYATRRCRVHY